MQKRVAHHADADNVLLTEQLDTLDIDGRHVAKGWFTFRGNRHAEAFEVVLADQMSSTLAHRIHVKRLGKMPHPPCQQHRTRFRRADEVTVFALNRIETSGKPRRSFLHRSNRNPVVHQGVQRTLQTVRGAGSHFPIRHVEADHLPACMHARIGAPGAHSGNLPPKQDGQRLLDGSLHRQLPRLPRETAKRRPVVGNRQGNGMTRILHGILSSSKKGTRKSACPLFSFPFLILRRCSPDGREPRWPS